MGVGGLGGGHHLLVGGLQASITNVVHRAGRKDHRLLRHDTNLCAQRPQRPITHVPTEYPQHSRLSLIKAQK